MRTPETRADGRRAGWTTFAIILSVSAVLAYIYFRQVGRLYFEERLELHGQILRGAAESPYRYRVLVPFIAEGLARALGAVLPGDGAFLLAYALYDLAAILLLLGALHRYLRAWFSNEQALIGVLFAAATMPVALRDHYFQPWSILEAALFAAGLLCIRDRRYRLLALVVALASLNRETAIFVPLAFLFAVAWTKGEDGENRPIGGRAALLFVGYAAIWAAAFFGLRLLLGDAPRVVTIGELLARNTSTPAIFRAVMRAALIFGAFWIFAAAGFRRAPAFVKRTALLAPLYLAAVALWGIWHEVRILMPLYAIVVPLGLSFLYRERIASPRSDP
ncbi:MAG: hypothetical protein NTW97_02090 [Candidatus Krumholzibacteria bacterium]|nr:hypothetical protein [Candidatus Krumholzibacteria bacterium]